MSNIGELIKKSRFDKSVKAVDMAKELNCTSQFISNWERGISNPPLNSIKKISKILGIKILDLKLALIKDFSEKLDKEIK